MATAKLIGPSSIVNYSGASANYAWWDKWTAEGTGRVSQIRVYGYTNGYVKVALYANNNGSPGTCLAKQDTSTAIVAGWNTITLESEASVTKDTVYWIATAAGDSSISYTYPTTGVVCKYKTITYSTWVWPDDPTNLLESNTWYMNAQGYGVLVLSLSTIPSAEVVGQPKLIFILKPSTIASQEAVGSPIVELAGTYIQPATIPSAEVVGSPSVIKLLQFLVPSTIPSAEVVGSPTILNLRQFLIPVTIPSAEAVGSPSVIKLLQFLVPSTIPSAEVVGIPSIGVFGIIVPVTIPSAETVGGPTLLKYVWHVILDALYSTETPDINRAFVIGRDVYGMPVYGEAHTTAESALVGQRLDFRQELAIPTTAQAGSMASAVLSKMRLTGKMALILIPPNCGQELFDTVQVTDKQANQSNAQYRVVGLRFEYNPRQARYHHKLILGAP
ncbi:MAG: hypothetical protein FJ023_09315 [Chloroflexi bacterium]|nr:hypothetical protein [Chloroflexota bacterium]